MFPWWITIEASVDIADPYFFESRIGTFTKHGLLQVVSTGLSIPLHDLIQYFVGCNVYTNEPLQKISHL